MKDLTYVSDILIFIVALRKRRLTIYEKETSIFSIFFS